MWAFAKEVSSDPDLLFYPDDGGQSLLPERLSRRLCCGFSAVLVPRNAARVRGRSVGHNGLDNGVDERCRRMSAPEFGLLSLRLNNLGTSADDPQREVRGLVFFQMPVECLQLSAVLFDNGLDGSFVLCNVRRFLELAARWGSDKPVVLWGESDRDA